MNPISKEKKVDGRKNNGKKSRDITDAEYRKFKRWNELHPIVIGGMVFTQAPAGRTMVEKLKERGGKSGEVWGIHKQTGEGGMTIEHARMLKESGLAIDETIVVKIGGGQTLANFGEKDMMEFCKEHGYAVWNPYLKQWLFRAYEINVKIADADLTECLVQACCAVAKGREGV